MVDGARTIEPDVVAIKTNKSDAARRQVEAAIRMLFSNEDRFAIHTVTAAAYRLLRDLAEHSGVSAIHNFGKLIIRPGKEKAFWTAMNKPANFLKHAVSDPNEVLELEEEANDEMITIYCLYYESLGFQMTPTMRSFVAWMTMLHPDLLADDAPMKKMVHAPALADVRLMQRIDQLKMGKQFLMLIGPNTQKQ